MNGGVSCTVAGVCGGSVNSFLLSMNWRIESSVFCVVSSSFDDNGATGLDYATLSGVIGVVVVALVLDLVFVVIAKVTTVRGLNV